MFRKWIVLGILFGFAGFAVLSLGCGQQQGESTTTTTVAPSGSSVTIKGTTSSGVSGMSVKSQGGLALADVIIGVCSKGSDSVLEVARGTTDADGNYSVNASIAALEAAKSGSYATNVMVTISKEGTVIGCVIPSVSLEAGKINFSPAANPGSYAKQKIARATFKKGIDPKGFDFTSNVDQKFSDSTLKDYDPTKIDAMAGVINDNMAAEDEIAAGLGISAEVIELMKKKGMELHKLYVEPLLQAAFQNKTPPNREQMDAAFASMEAEMIAYAKSLGVTEQQIADFHSMKDKQMETKMGQESSLKNDASFGESKRRMMGNKITSLFLGQYDAANTIATMSPSGKTSYKDASGSSANYSKFVASKEVIVARLNAMVNDPTITPEQIPNYLRTNFFDAFIFPSATGKPTMEGGAGDNQKIDTMMDSYSNNRIMVYFMKTFLNEQQRMTYFTSQESAMQPIFTNRFNNENSPYYMGPKFWSTQPTPEQIQARLALFNAALDAAMDNNTALQSIFVSAGFTSAQAQTILKAFRIIMAPPDAM